MLKKICSFINYSFLEKQMKYLMKPVFILFIAVLIMMMTTATVNATTVSTMGYSCEKSINNVDHCQIATTSADLNNGATTTDSTPALSTTITTINGTMTVNTMNSTVVQLSITDIDISANSAITASGTKEDAKLKGDLVILPITTTAITVGFSQAGSLPANSPFLRC